MKIGYMRSKKPTYVDSLTLTTPIDYNQDIKVQVG